MISKKLVGVRGIPPFPQKRGKDGAPKLYLVAGSIKIEQTKNGPRYSRGPSCLGSLLVRELYWRPAAGEPLVAGWSASGEGLRLLVPFRTGRGSDVVGGRGFPGRQTVFHQPDMHAAGLHLLGLLLDNDGGIAQGYCVQPVDGNLMFCDEVALDRLGQPA